MKETPQEYTQRILGNVEGQNPLKVQAGTAKKLERLIKGVPASKLRKRPAPEKWSVARNPRASGRLGNCHGLEDAADSGRAWNADSGVRSGLLGGRRPLRKARPAQIRRAIPRGARSKSGPAEVAHAGTVETPRHARRAWRGDHRAHRSHDRRTRHQSHETDRADSWAKKK